MLMANVGICSSEVIDLLDADLYLVAVRADSGSTRWGDADAKLLGGNIELLAGGNTIVTGVRAGPAVHVTHQQGRGSRRRYLCEWACQSSGSPSRLVQSACGGCHRSPGSGPGIVIELLPRRPCPGSGGSGSGPGCSKTQSSIPLILRTAATTQFPAARSSQLQVAWQLPAGEM